jgi:hypothetical protein
MFEPYGVEYWRQPEFRGGFSKCQAENGHGNSGSYLVR